MVGFLTHEALLLEMTKGMGKDMEEETEKGGIPVS
jgi:hypothetical protein